MAYDMRISDWSSDVCSSDLLLERYGEPCPEAMVESALNHARILEDEDFFEFKISCKASDVFLAVAAYTALADACDYPLHLGVTEAGGLRTGTIQSSIGMGTLDRKSAVRAKGVSVRVDLGGRRIIQK